MSINKLAIAYRAATPGTWGRTTDDDGLEHVWTDERMYQGVEIVTTIIYPNSAEELKTVDAEFIVLAHNKMPALLEMYDLLKATVALFPVEDLTAEQFEVIDCCRFIITEQEGKTTLDYDQWLSAFEDHLTCLAAETGADRELDFDRGDYLEKHYNNYVAAQ